MNILGIETSCDETAAAVVRDGRDVISNVVYTQIPLHQPYGGVVPEIASRAHIEKITQVVSSALSCLVPHASCLAETNHPCEHEKAMHEERGTRNEERGTRNEERSTRHEARSTRHGIDAIAVTYGPGLAPALIVGLNFAKGLAASLNVPLIAINHLEAHLHTPFLREAEEHSSSPVSADSTRGTRHEERVPNPEDCTPALGLVVSGGHTNWVDIPEYGVYKTIGQTLDDAAGEAFDKAAKLLGLGYPGGPVIDRIAKQYLAEHPSLNDLIPFPKGRPREGVSALAGLPADLCVSFSGLKTALLRHVQREGDAEKDRIVASYQEAIVQALADRTATALRRRPYKSLVLGGGVSLNSRVRQVLGDVCRRAGIPLLMAKPKFCGDNGAMIAGLAYYRRNIIGDAAMLADVSPSLEVG